LRVTSPARINSAARDREQIPSFDSARARPILRISLINLQFTSPKAATGYATNVKGLVEQRFFQYKKALNFLGAPPDSGFAAIPREYRG